MGLGGKRVLGKFATAVALVLVVALAGCSGDDGGGGDGDAGGDGSGGVDTTEATSAVLPAETGPIGPASDEGAPVEGGVLRVILGNSDPGGLDPIKNFGSGQTGLNELTAIYDALVRYDPVANEYVPQLAESVTANADSSVYTVKLRAGVKFTDGTPLNSAAVKFGFERFSGPGSVFTYAAIFPQIVSMETPDDLTVVITLDGPDPSFPYMMTLSFGQVVSPTAVEKMGAEAFNLNPVGAGPFMVKSYTPGVGVSLVRNPDYWGPAAHLDGIDFTWVADDRARVEALKNGDVDVVNVLDPVQGAQAFDDGARGFGWLTYGSPVVSMNMRDGYPFADEKLRQAVAYALDPEVINTRVFEGLGYPSKDLFPTGLLSSGATGIATDVDKARELVQAAKDAGWDGSFTLLASPEPSVHNVALSVQAMLNNVGFNAVVETPPDWITNVYVNFDYDAVVTSLGFLETDPYAFLVYETGGDYSPTGVKDPRLDAAVIELRAATNEDETKAATKKIQEVWNEIVPSVWLGHRVDRMFYGPNVHNLVPSASSIALFNELWLSQ